ncbi:FAD-binding oxidoreductase [Mycolicibacterium smegmatis]|uniref:FAD-binding oxidoreductase n=1 Tax=Mycolicibacterium smegmatis TaxID=1772 RepID=UPI0013030BB1|nr:FAD-binding oxidoreductase [Mycolicibacterium smegmatis]
MLQVHPTMVDELAMSMPERVHLPGSPEYGDAVAIWNGAVTERPAAVVRPTSSGDVQNVVRFAHEQRIPVTVRAGGHDWGGRALNEGGLVIDLSSMRKVYVDPAAREALVEGGATAEDVVQAAERHGLTAAAPNLADVGFTGFTLGGGYGPLNGIAGLGVDNLLEAHVVLADGRSVTANAGDEADLLWALRGGGANFGVVTHLRVRLHPVPHLATGVLMFPWEQAADVMRRYDALAPSLPDGLTAQIGVIPAPDGGPVVFVAPYWVGDPDEGDRWVGELRRLGTPVVDQVAPMSPSAQLRLLDPLVPRGRHYEMRTVNVETLSSGVIDALVAAGSSRTSPASVLALHHFHGASTRVGVTDTAFGLRTPHFLVEIVAAWDADSGDDGERHRHWAQSTFDALGAHALPGGYPNLIGPDQRNQADAAYGPNAERLLAVKDRWDAGNVFTAIPLPSRSVTS